MLCSVPKDKSIQRDYKPQIEQHNAKNKTELLKLSIFAMLANKLFKVDGNHAITLIKDIIKCSLMIQQIYWFIHS